MITTTCRPPLGSCPCGRFRALDWRADRGRRGLPLGAFLRPLTADLERRARSVWGSSPLLVHVERDPSIIWAGDPDWVAFSTYFRDPLQLDEPPADRTEWLDWARRRGGVDASQTQLQVILQAKTDVAVVVEGLRVRQEIRPVQGGCVLVRPVGGADLVPRHFHVDLDWGSSPLVTYRGAGSGEPEDIPRMKIPAGDIERFHIWAEADSGWHDWTLDLLLLVEGRRLVVPINDEGAPFRTVGSAGLPLLRNIAGTSTVDPWSLDDGRP